jgi:hypothetical protein
VIAASLGLVSLPAKAAIIKVSISGMYDGANPYGTDFDVHSFTMNYLVNSKSVKRFQKDVYYVDPDVDTGPIYRSFGSLESFYYNDEDAFTVFDRTNIPFHAISGGFYSEFDDPYYVRYLINDPSHPFVDGLFMYVNFGYDASYNASGVYGNINLHLPDDVTVPIDEVSISYSVLAPGSVPEPATWVMLLVGFGAIGGMVRRRRAGVPLASC